MNPLIQKLQAWLGPNATAIRALMAPLFIVMVLAMMVLPLPAFALDIFFTFNIAMALMVMMVASYMVRPLDFAVAPFAERGIYPRGADGGPHRAGCGRCGD
jgi:flagellar biosynthesis protein FlhA